MRVCFPSFFPSFFPRRKRKKIDSAVFAPRIRRGVQNSAEPGFRSPDQQPYNLQTYLEGAAARESRLVATGVVLEPPSMVIHVIPRRPNNQESCRYRYKSLTVRDKTILDSIVLYIQRTGYMLKRTAMERSLWRLLPSTTSTEGDACLPFGVLLRE